MKLSSAESGTVNFDNTLNNHLLWADMENKECALCFTLLLPWNIKHQLNLFQPFLASQQWILRLLFSLWLMIPVRGAHTIGLLRPLAALANVGFFKWETFMSNISEW